MPWQNAVVNGCSVWYRDEADNTQDEAYILNILETLDKLSALSLQKGYGGVCHEGGNWEGPIEDECLKRVVLDGVRSYARVNLHVNVTERVWVRVGWAMALKIFWVSVEPKLLLLVIYITQ